MRREKRNAYTILMGKPEGKRHWEDLTIIIIIIIIIISN
jgi:hypothetical protein